MAAAIRVRGGQQDGPEVAAPNTSKTREAPDHYGAADVDRVEQIRGLLDSGLTTEIIRRILPFLGCGIHLPAQCLTAETAELLEGEAERLGQRIACLSRNRDAILGYLAAVRGSL